MTDASGWRQQAEDAIVERLAPLVDIGCGIEDRPKFMLPTARAQLQIFYEGSTLGEPLANYGQRVVQPRTVRFRINVQIVDPRSHQFIYPLMDAIDNLLTGFEPLPKVNRPCTIRNDNYVETKDGKWFYTYLLDFEMYAMQVAKG